MNTLFSHVCVVTMDDRMSVWTDAFVGVTDGKISYLSKHAPEEKPDQIIDATGMVLMPGLINCHTHLPMQLLRGYADDLKLQEWLNDYISRARTGWTADACARRRRWPWPNV